MNNTHEQSSSLRTGKVCEYDSLHHRARVRFPDMGIISSWLPVIHASTYDNAYESPLLPGEHVACMVSGNGAEFGYILGAVYDDKNEARLAQDNLHGITFSDGTRIVYDTGSHSLQVSSPETVNIDAQNSITLKADKVSVDAKAVALSGGSSGSMDLSARTITATAPRTAISGETVTISGTTITLSGNVICPGCR